ncbi:hypothetical protein L798_09943 [Zootermopsis nevadensis]|uniref:Uncharacterized protein n=1 Tax=Zootermopsis nevadensis TaxID=136037 RepID=A0A067QPC2_ZOONE|nr:hypothetical protein L798_09943 [Zootermopsis nevadensis]
MIAETDVEVQQRLQKWDKFLVSGEVAAGENKTNHTENVSSASNEEQKGVVKNYVNTLEINKIQGKKYLPEVI